MHFTIIQTCEIMNNQTCEIFDFIRAEKSIYHSTLYNNVLLLKKRYLKIWQKKKENNDRRTVISNFKVFIASMEYIVLYLYCYTIPNVIRA